MNTTPRPPCGACGLFEGHDKPEDCDLHPDNELPASELPDNDS
jgi:hypothetical protein